MERDGLFVPNLWHYARLTVALAAAFVACVWLVHARCWLSGGLLMSIFWQQARHNCSSTGMFNKFPRFVAASALQVATSASLESDAGAHPHSQ